MRALGLGENCDAIVTAESKRKQYVRESAELYATDCNEEEEGALCETMWKSGKARE